MGSIWATLEQMDSLTLSSTEKGEWFELLMYYYFKRRRLYEQRFTEVWRWCDVQQPLYDGGDHGIDLVARERVGGYCAIQCKFYAEDTVLDKSKVDSFLAASCGGEITSKILVNTGGKLSTPARKQVEADSSCSVIGLSELEGSNMDWPEVRTREDILKLCPTTEFRALREHQQEAYEDVLRGFEVCDRGRLIMACGTGKTLLSLRLAEDMVGVGGVVVYLVPTIALISQVMWAWDRDCGVGYRYLSVCSDESVGKGDLDSNFGKGELVIPPSTNIESVTRALREIRGSSEDEMTVIFSTYHSIDVLVGAQDRGIGVFDLVICDEAHHTTGVERVGQEASAFLRIHDRERLRTKKCLFMTATQRLYGEVSKKKAEAGRIPLYSMDDERKYGPVFHEFKFSQAIERGILSDYQVIVLQVSESDVKGVLTDLDIGDDKKVLNISKVGKYIGCWKGILGPLAREDGGVEDILPRRRGIAFTSRIKDSRLFERQFWNVIKHADEVYDPSRSLTDMVCEVRHIDGGDTASKRKESIQWLSRHHIKDNECRILTNARCLSEGVDVPDLDVVVFLEPRRSIVDIVQAVGRVMRKKEGKKYGYIILPVVVAPGQRAEDVLDRNEAYATVWEVLRALRSHDDSLLSWINRLDLNEGVLEGSKVRLMGVDDKGDVFDMTTAEQYERMVEQLEFGFMIHPDMIYAKIVERVGDRQYLRFWANDVARVVGRDIERIRELLKRSDVRGLFDVFLGDLRKTLNPSIEEKQAIDVLAQHMVTRPVFEALFRDYDFVGCNPVSVSMGSMVGLLEGVGLAAEAVHMEAFYESIRCRVEGVRSYEGRQRVIKELYENFFKRALAEEARRLGIVYTPNELIEFILYSTQDVLQEQFGVGLSDEGVHILDPFTGTGSFLVQLLHNQELILDKDLRRKFTHELHANEILLLAYYIAAISIEEAFHSRCGLDDTAYEAFKGIVYCDTFMLSRSKQGAFEGFSPENSERMKEQQKQIIKVIMGNPPWSAFNQDLRYPEMDKRIFETYQKYTSTTLKNALYDAYVRSLRWASDRLGEDGVIAFVTNGSFIDSSTGDGIRKCWREEFQTIYCFNLRGDVHQGKKEGGSVFGSGTTRRVAITLLIKNSQYKHKPCQIFYKDIGDYLTRDEKLEKIASLKSIKGIDDWQRIEPDAYNDWINLRDPTFQQYMPLGSDDTKRGKANDAIFYSFCRGVATNRDAWVYNSSKEVLRQNMQHTITFYNQQIDENRQVPIQSLSDITWTRRIKKLFQKRERVIYKDSHIRLAMYRPFFKQWLYLDHAFNEEVYKIPSFFPTAETENQLICITGKGSKKPFSTFIVDTIPDLNLLAAGVQCFPRYTYEELEDRSLFSELREWRRVDNILDETLERFCRHYNDRSITKDDIFYYVYGVLHSYEYREMYGSNLTRELPRIPLARDFRVFVRAGRDLAHLHLRYEELDGYRLREEWSGMGSSLGFIGGEEWGGMGRYVGGEERYYRVEKLRYGKKRGLVRGKERVVKDRSMIVLNEYLTVSGIPEDAYRYEVNGRTPLDWLVERYRVLSDEGSGIVNDVNSWGGLWYILGLIGRLVRVGVESYEIMKSLPSPFE